MKNKLTSKEIEAIHHIRNWLVHNGRAPSVRELMVALKYKSPRSAQIILEKLLKLEVIKKNKIGDIQLNKEIEFGTNHAQTIDVPLVGLISCGTPILAEENVEAIIPVSIMLAKPPSKYFILRATGDSMDLAGIQDNDLVLVKQQEDASNGDKVVALIDDSATIKEFHREKGFVILKPKSSNPNNKPIVLTDEFRIQGVVETTIPAL